MKNVNKFLYIGKVEAGGRLIQNIERFPVGLLAELIVELASLLFTSGQCVARLSQGDVAHANIVADLECPRVFWNCLQASHGLFNAHAKNSGDIFVVVTNAERLFVETLAAADLTIPENIRQKTHLLANLSLSC